MRAYIYLSENAEDALQQFPCGEDQYVEQESDDGRVYSVFLADKDDLSALQIYFLDQNKSVKKFAVLPFDGKLDIADIQLSKTAPQQGASANLRAGGYQGGDMVVIYYDVLSESYGFCSHGISNDGHLYIGDDHTGCSSAAEAKEEAIAMFENEE